MEQAGSTCDNKIVTISLKLKEKSQAYDKDIKVNNFIFAI